MARLTICHCSDSSRKRPINAGGLGWVTMYLSLGCNVFVMDFFCITIALINPEKDRFMLELDWVTIYLSLGKHWVDHVFISYWPFLSFVPKETN